MRRADRLFQLVLLLSRGKVRTSAALAERLGVSVRTVYRDIADLVAQGTPIEGAPGIGYALRAGYQLPPLMFDREELEALALGAAWAARYADRAIGEAAERVLAKVDAVLPERLRPALRAEGLEIIDFSIDEATRTHLATARLAVGARIKLDAHYRDEAGRESVRRLWPLGLYYWGRIWTLAAWCELRRDYRSFRVDRFIELVRREEPVPADAGISLAGYLARVGADTGPC
jgi:predicted DNA-binding transcriptional regulator YafY